MKITIRLDDITPYMKQPPFLRMKKLLDGYGIKPLIGVVPDCQDHSLMHEVADIMFWKKVQSLVTEGWHVAMHGLTHVYSTRSRGLFPLNRQSEFAGISFAVQRQMLIRGREILKEHDIRTDIFMAPSHSYDGYTLKALKEAGFKYVTDGFGRFPYKSGDLIFLPIAVKRDAALTDTRDGITTIVTHTDTMTEADFEFFDKLLRTGSAVSYGKMLETAPVERGITGHAAEYGTAFAKHTAVKLRGIVKQIKR